MTRWTRDFRGQVGILYDLRCDAVWTEVVKLLFHLIISGSHSYDIFPLLNLQGSNFPSFKRWLYNFIMNPVARIYHPQHVWRITWEQPKISRSELIGFHSLKRSPASVIRLSQAPPLTFDFCTIIRKH